MGDRGAGPGAVPDPGVLVELVALFRRLRAECAWKAAQTHRSLARYLIEESYEAVEAIEAGDPDRLCEELGDVLLQVHLHAAIAEQAGEFTIADVARGLREKMIRRNPHVFGDVPAPRTPEEVEAIWQRMKALEKLEKQHEQQTGLMAGVPSHLPALLRADKLLERAERAGRPVAVGAGADPDDLGERLLGLVAQARRAGIDPEAALRETVRRHEEAADA